MLPRKLGVLPRRSPSAAWQHVSAAFPRRLGDPVAHEGAEGRCGRRVLVICVARAAALAQKLGLTARVVDARENRFLTEMGGRSGRVVQERARGLIGSLLAVIAAPSLAHAALPQPWQLNFQPAASPIDRKSTRFSDGLLVVVTLIVIFV